MKRLILVLLCSSACTSINVAKVPDDRAGRGVFVTQEGLSEPYESLGLIQVTRRGVYAFGFADPAGANIDEAINDTLVPQIRQAGADGVMNVRYSMIQHTLPAKIFGAIFFFAPLPAEVTITGELVRLRSNQPAPSPTQPAPPTGVPL